MSKAKLNLAIIGVGLIGGSLGLCLKDKLGDDIYITGLCRSDRSMQRAMELGAVDYAGRDLEKVVGNADIIFLSPPVLQIVPMVETILPYLKKGAILTDAGSTKQYIWDHLKTILPPDIYYIAGHPMTTLDIAKHDRCASVISHVPHLTAAALVTLLKRSGDDRESCIKLIGGGFKDTTRIASSNADMWADICMTNGPAITNNLKELQDIVGEVITAIENHDRQAIYDYFTASKALRDSILEDATKKFDPN